MPAADHLGQRFHDFMHATSGAALPVSGEQVMMPPPRSVHNKPPKPFSPEEGAQVKRAGAGRRAWEGTDVGQARTSGLPADVARQAAPAQVHLMQRYGRPEPKGPRVYDRQLPGMVDPDAAPRPPKWEELSAENQQHTIKALKMAGTDIQTMSRDFGAQLDQAAMRAGQHGPDTRPYAEDFYESGAPRQKIDASARELGIPATLHAQLNAFTSPNTKFSQNTADGQTKFPNDDAARHAAVHVQRGLDPASITNDTTDTIQLPKPPTSKNSSKFGSVQGYTTNLKKAAEAMQRHEGGLSPDPAQFKGSPKTGPYANSWNDTHPQFTVADVHTGGGGNFPHLSSEKPMIRGADGKVTMSPRGTVKRNKSEREIALERVPFSHSAVDFANRTAMKERGLGHVRESQAAEWGEEQLQRGEAGMKGGPKHADVYPTPKKRPQIPGQISADF